MKQPHTLVIGGTKGVGRALVKVLVQEGDQTISVLARNLPTDDTAIDGADYFIGDLLDFETLETSLMAIIEANGPLTGLAFFQRFRGKEDRWTNEIALSLTATKAVIETLSDHFDDSREGGIVIVNSVIGQFVADEQPVSYHVSKAGLLHMARYYAVALGPKHIRVNSVSFGVVLKDESREFYMQQDELRRTFEILSPMGRMGEAEEVANAVAWLLGPKSTFVTGQNIIVDGGVSLQAHDSVARNMSAARDITITRQEKE